MSPKLPRMGLEVERQSIAKCWLSMMRTRGEIGDAWKWPNSIDCIRFAFQELAEADDELMRSGDDGYLRRRDETGNSFIDEIGMCAVMLLSVWQGGQVELMRWNVHNVTGYGPSSPTIADIAIKIAMAWRYFQSGTLADLHDHSGFVTVASAVDLVYHLLGGAKQFETAVERALAKARERVEYKKSKKYLYLKGMGLNCPECGSSDIEAVGPAHFDDNWARREAVCCACSYRWIDVYELSDMQDVDS